MILEEVANEEVEIVPLNNSIFLSVQVGLSFSSDWAVFFMQGTPFSGSKLPTN